MADVWFLVRADMHKHEKMAALSSDTARLGWYVVLAEGKVQKHQGQFASEAHFKAVVGRFARYLKEYVGAGLMDCSDDGRLLVHDWQKHQWAGKKAGQREDNGGTNEGQTEDPHAGASALSLSLSSVLPAGGVGVAGEEGDADHLEAWFRLTGSWPSPKVTPWLNELAEAHTPAGVSAALAAEIIEDPSRKTLLGRTQSRLEREAHERAKHRPRRLTAAEEIASEQAQLEAAMTPEQRAANLERLRQAMIDAGLTSASMKGETA